MLEKCTKHRVDHLLDDIVQMLLDQHLKDDCKTCKLKEKYGTFCDECKMNKEREGESIDGCYERQCN